MIIIEIKRRYKFNYIILRNRTEIARFNTKKQARDYLYKLYKDFEQLNKTQNIFRFDPFILQNQNVLALYTEKRLTFEDTLRFETKDVFKIQRIINQ